ncbi:MAG: ABC transporter ATP-binding protein [Pseudobdellovibrionaceae bacterium]
MSSLHREVLMEAQGITKSYSQGTSRLEILKGIDLTLYAGEALCIVGSSGAGKSTLLHVLGTLDLPDTGTLKFRNEDLHAKTEEELAKFRNEKMGFVFQFHHLMTEFTALENVILPCQLAGMDKNEAEARSRELFDLMGLDARKHHFPSELSGGELQRVAIARALVCRPQILFADEPTGNLDSKNGKMIQDLFFSLKDRLQLTVVVVTHDTQFAKRFSRVLTMHDGRLHPSI